MSEARERRVVAVVLPDLLCEIANAALTVPAKLVPPSPSAHGDRGPRCPLPFSWKTWRLQNDEHSDERALEVSDPRATIAAVNDTAKRFGVRVGQTVIEAQALLAHLVVRKVTREQVRERLGEIAEVALSFGPTVAVESPDTVWVDVTGAVHLAGGESALALDLVARVRALGHAAKVAVSGGPRLAQAFARWGRVNREGSLVVPPEETVRTVATLPVQALPLDAERAEWLVRLGVFTVGELSRLPRAATASRLGDDASQVLDLAEGRDEAPLVAHVPQALPAEETTWDEPAFGVEPLLFVLRGLVSRLSARLEGRGEAVQALALVVLHDRATARFEDVAPSTVLYFELSSPLYRPEELSRVIASRLGRTELPAPTVGLRLEARAITRALSLQLSLSRYAVGLGGNPTKGPETLPVVLSELMTDLGKDKVGVLRLDGSHRPEKKSRLAAGEPQPRESAWLPIGIAKTGESAALVTAGSHAVVDASCPIWGSPTARSNAVLRTPALLGRARRLRSSACVRGMVDG